MSEEIKKEVQDAELNPEELDKVAGGVEELGIYKCPDCGQTFLLESMLKDHLCIVISGPLSKATSD